MRHFVFYFVSSLLSHSFSSQRYLQLYVSFFSWFLRFMLSFFKVFLYCICSRSYIPQSSACMNASCHSSSHELVIPSFFLFFTCLVRVIYIRIYYFVMGCLHFASFIYIGLAVCDISFPVLGCFMT